MWEVHGPGLEEAPSVQLTCHCELHPRTHITAGRLGRSSRWEPRKGGHGAGEQAQSCHTGTTCHFEHWAGRGANGLWGAFPVSTASYPTSSYVEVLGTQEIDSQTLIISQASGRRKHSCKEILRIQSEAFKPRGAHKRRWC